MIFVSSNSAYSFQKEADPNADSRPAPKTSLYDERMLFPKAVLYLAPRYANRDGAWQLQSRHLHEKARKLLSLLGDKWAHESNFRKWKKKNPHVWSGLVEQAERDPSCLDEIVGRCLAI